MCECRDMEELCKEGRNGSCFLIKFLSKEVLS